MSKNISDRKKKLSAPFTIFRRLPLLLSLTRRAFLFAFFVLIAQILLFFTGNIQNFLDDNLRLILTFSCCTSIAMAFFSFAAVVECVYFFITTRKKFYWVHFAIFMVFFISAVIISITTNSISILSQGINLE